MPNSFMRLVRLEQKKCGVPNEQLGSKTIAVIRIKITGTGRQVLAEPDASLTCHLSKSEGDRWKQAGRIFVD